MSLARRKRVLILGAAGRDFHNFNVVYREEPATEVVAFTAAQIPGIAGRRYPASLAGPRYRQGIPIEPEEDLERLIRELSVDEVVFAYSDVSHEDVMHLASRTLAAGSDFALLGPRRTMLASSVPVVAVCAVRTGCGKSAVSRHFVRILRERRRRVVVVRHPMPYGDLVAARVQRFATLADLDAAGVTIEEREEYEPHLEAGCVVYAGVDYGAILARAQAEADVIVWDGGNNDLPFFAPALHICLVDPHRPGHESRHHPGEANLRAADVAVIVKEDSAPPASVEAVRVAIRALNPRARIVDTRLPVTVDGPERLAGRRVLAVEDGPTLTHGGLGAGAAVLAARRYGAMLVDPRPYARGDLRRALERHPAIGPVLPALGYNRAQLADLEATIEGVPCDLVLLGTPIDLGRIIQVRRPLVRVRYEIEEVRPGSLEELLVTIDRRDAMKARSKKGRVSRSKPKRARLRKQKQGAPREPRSRQERETSELGSERLSHPESSPILTGGDVDADWQRATSTGEEAVGGSVATPDQDVVDELGRALGVEQPADAEVRTSEEMLRARDRHYWHLEREAAEREKTKDGA
jgi:predicted GTPase